MPVELHNIAIHSAFGQQRHLWGMLSAVLLQSMPVRFRQKLNPTFDINPAETDNLIEHKQCCLVHETISQANVS